MSPSAGRFEITLEGPCPQSLRDLLGTRYDVHPADPVSSGTLIINDLDQASLRAILSLLWDAGLDVISASRAG